MRESKFELAARLKDAGQWDDFITRREELKAGGMPAVEAQAKALAEFPPNGQLSVEPVLPTETPSSTEAVPLVDLSPLKGKPSVSILECVKWTMEHLDRRSVMPADAPSAGAWSMLFWARSSLSARGEFYRSFVVKLLPKGANQDSPNSGIAATDDPKDIERMQILLGDDDGRRINDPDGLS